MASSDLRVEVTCSICMDIYTDPVTLKCGHSFCRLCVTRSWDNKQKREYSCPECRQSFRVRPELKRNLRLCNIAEYFSSSEPMEKKVGIACTYCVHSSVPAAKTCLHCEVSLCEDHLKAHSKSEEHVLLEPTISLEHKKCSVHRKLLHYYCFDDSICMCVLCRLDGGHQGHQVETLEEASDKKKANLRNVLQKLTTKRDEVEKKVQSLHEYRRKIQEKAAGVTQQVTAPIWKIREKLEALEKRVLSEISRQQEQVTLRVSDLIQQLEIKKEELSRNIGHIEELCNVMDPLTVLQEETSKRTDYGIDEEANNEGREKNYSLVHAVGDLDENMISMTLNAGIIEIVTGVKVQLDAHMASDIQLDINTAANNVNLFQDNKTISCSENQNQSHPETPERFQDYQVLSTRRFASGRHYWEVETSKCGEWRIGIAYPSIDRRGDQSFLGQNKKSWCLQRSGNQYAVNHDSTELVLPSNPSSQCLGISLDYEAGRLSFYELCDPIRHLHTFTATFTEPLHVGFYINCKAWIRIRRYQW